MSEELPPDVADADSVRPLPVDRETQPVDGEGAPRLAFPVVGLGASAGGLEAYTEFLQAMPANSGMAFVLIQHLSPKHESMIAEILSRHTTMPVLQVEDGMKVEADHVYVIRPGHTMTIHNGHLHLGKSLLAPGHNRPVDDFFRSLAEEQRERAIGIILSGMGSNGSAGAQMIKAVGGICIAQDPDSCKFASMPRSLIESGVADFVMKPAEMPELLSKYANHPYAKGERSKAASRNRRDAGALDEILTVLRTRTRVDYRGYKKPTVLRRVQRRMGLHQVTAMGDYVRTLRQNPSEISALSDDLLIHVTGFFRDPDAWNRLRETVILPLVQQREDEASIRCWVTACSSGEEAYTLAILLLEAAESVNKRFEIKIFATDMAERTLQHARAGIYPGGIESEITPERLERFFEKDDAFYHVKQELREVVVFAPQNLLQDPPFSRLDIVSCRNLLIYLEPETQQRVMALLHFGLREGGTLFLGTSETIGDDELFEPIDKTWRIFRRIGPTRHGAVVFPPAHALTVRMNELEASATEPKAIVRSSVPQAANRLLLEQFTPAAVVVDRQGRIVFYHGSTARFLAQPPGEPTRDLLVMARDTVRGALRSAFGRAMDSGEAVQVKDGIIDTETGRQRVEIRAVPLEGRVTSAYFLISFIAYPESTPPIEPPKGNGDHYAWATGELQRVRDELQSTVEELQTSNEEMKASHEEITSINEELQSTNEELETSKEELQSLNEELTTVNAQLQAKMDELERTTNDLSSLLASTDIAVIFLDTKFRIRRFTPAVKDLVEMISADIGRPMRDLAPKYDDPQLLPDAQAVLEKLIPIEREIVAGEHTYLRRVLPYRTGDNRIDGVVVTFTDITGRVKAEAALRNSEEEYRLIVHGVKDHAIFAIDLDGRIATWNPGAERVLGYSQAEAVGQPAAMIFTPEDRAAAAPEAERSEAVRTGRGIDERWHVRKDGSQFWASGSLAAVYDDNGKPRAFVKVMRDMTEQKQAAEAQRLSEERLRRAIGIETVGVIFFKADGSITEANDAFLRMSGYTRDDLAVGSVRWDTQTPHEFMPQSLKAVNEFLTHGRTTPYEKQYIRKDGSRWWALFAAARVSDDEGVEFIVDITESKRAEVALMESEARFRGVADVVGEMLWQCDPDGKPVWHNQRWTDFTGLTTEQSMQDEWMKTVHPDDVEETRVTFRESIRSGEPWRREHRIRRASDGAYRWFLVQGMPQRDGNGRIRSWFGSVTDIHEQRTTLDALRESDERYRAVVETSENAIFRISADTVTLLEMRGGGFLQDETAAKPNWVDAYVHPGDRQTVLAAWREALESRTHFSLEHRVRRADGSWGWSYSRAVPLEKEPGHLLEWFGVASDITVRKQEEEERTALLEQERDSRGEAELANSAKDEFIANASHELRTPLAAILLWGKLLQGKKVDPKALKDGLQAIVQSANAQQRLIEDLLDTARIATGKLRLELLETDLAATVSAAVETVRPTAVVKGVEIVTDMGSDIGMVMADSDRLRQVVWNLLSNAVKFTPQGGTVNIGMWRRGGWVEIRVTDSGRGIAPDMVDHVFERFNQSDPASTRRSGGLGLGLAISRQLVELHGGTITAASEGPGKGAAFTVMLPLPSGDMAQQLEAAFDLTGRLKGVRILLVEDDETTRDAMTAVLKKTGAIVQAVDSVDDALAAIDKERPDLLLSDIGLPLKDGYHLVRELRQRELDNNQPALPAVALTAFGRLMDQAKGLESGFNEHLSKPIEPRRLVAILQRLVRQSESS